MLVNSDEEPLVDFCLPFNNQLNNDLDPKQNQLHNVVNEILQAFKLNTERERSDVTAAIG